jgi:hypothetical protein
MQISCRGALSAVHSFCRNIIRVRWALAPTVLSIWLPAPSAHANQHTYGFYCELVGGSLSDAITKPYYDIDPYGIYHPEMRGTMSIAASTLTDLLPDDPLRGCYADNSLSTLLSFRLEGQEFSLLGNFSFDTQVNGSSSLLVFNDFFRISFLFHEANFPTDAAANLLALSTERGESDIGLWTLTAFGGGYAYSDRAVGLWHETALVHPSGAKVPETLPLYTFVATLLMTFAVYRVTRLKHAPMSEACSPPP